MHLSGCVSLEELPASVLDLSKLETLNVSGCSSLKWDNLEDYVNGIPELSTRHSDILPNLKFVDLTITLIQIIPSFITHSPVLELDCADCTKLTKFEVIPSMEILDLTYSLIEEVVELEKMKKLKHLNLSQNKHLILISGDFPESGSLEMINLESYTKLSRLLNSIGNLAHLTSLDLSCTALEELPSSIGDLTRLSELLFVGKLLPRTFPYTANAWRGFERRWPLPAREPRGSCSKAARSRLSGGESRRAAGGSR
ncbi:unnamed protein product [Linum trigynum]|uniref:Uncharacterized protein n=1 Tax=Linum trigynum TaxID=586398 RepID=A0AAV2GSG6_9ROSI